MTTTKYIKGRALSESSWFSSQSERNQQASKGNKGRSGELLLNSRFQLNLRRKIFKSLKVAEKMSSGVAEIMQTMRQENGFKM